MLWAQASEPTDSTSLKASVFKSLLSKEVGQLKFIKDNCEASSVSDFMSLGARTDITSGKDNSYYLDCRTEEADKLCRLTFAVKGKESGSVILSWPRTTSDGLHFFTTINNQPKLIFPTKEII